MNLILYRTRPTYRRILTTQPLLRISIATPYKHILHTTATAKMRIPYVDPEPANLSTEDQAVYDRVAARRAPRPLQPLDLALLHNPRVADGWNSFLGAIRTATSLPDDLREIAICRVAVMNGATYEWKHHAPLAHQGGVSSQGVNRLMVPEMTEGMYNPSGNGKGLNEKQFVVCKFTDESTKNVKVSEKTFKEAQR